MTNTTDPRLLNHHHHDCMAFSWKPIIAGALAATGFSFLLNLFSVAIGLTAYTTGSDGIETLAFGGLIATGIGIIVSMFASGWIAGYLGINYCANRHLGALYGFLAWAVGLIIAILIASHVQQYVNFYGHFISGTADSLQVTNNASSASPVKVAGANMDANKLVISTYILFALFFLSAFASTLGGHVGMRYRFKHEVM